MVRARSPARTYFRELFIIMLCITFLMNFILPPKILAADGTIEKKGINIVLVAEAKDGKKLSGSLINVYNDKDKAIWRGTTKTDGTTTWTNAESGTYKLKVTKFSKGYTMAEPARPIIIYENASILGDRVFVHTTTNDPESISKEENSKKARLFITKLDSQNSKPIKNLKFQILDNKDDVVYEGSTNKDGELYFDVDKNAEYRFKEVVAPDGYKKSDKVNSFYVDKDGQISAVKPDTVKPKTDGTTNTTTPDNGIKVRVTLSKTDAETKKGVSGAEFTIYETDGTKIYSDITDKDGNIIFEAAPGEYVFKETKSPEGYLEVSKKYLFKVKDDGSIYGTTSITGFSDGKSSSKDSKEKNEKLDEKNIEKPSDKSDKDKKEPIKTSVNLEVKNIVDNSAIAEVEVGIVDSKNKEVAKKTSDKEGKIKIDELIPGSYEFFKVSTGDGYYKSDKHEKFTVSDDGKISGPTVLKLTPQGTVVITVTDQKDNSIIEDAEITIWDSNKAKVFTQKTDSNGSIYFAVPELGTYSFKETATPKNYLSNDGSYEFTVKDGFEISGTTTIQNQKDPKATTTTSATNTSNPAITPTGNVDASSSEGVPQTGIEDKTKILLLIALALLATSAGCFAYLKKRSTIGTTKGGNVLK